MKKGNYRYIIWLVFVFMTSCTEKRNITIHFEEPVTIFPDYQEVKIPYNIAPLNFSLSVPVEKAVAIFSCPDYQFEVKASKQIFTIPASKWKQLLENTKGGKFSVRIQVKTEQGWGVYPPFYLYVAEESIDPYIAYRLIEPGYALWNRMGIYQRNLETYQESVIYENKSTRYNCVNCHSFCMQNPEQMMFHIRAKYPGTIVRKNGEMIYLDTNTRKAGSAFTYPAWHPSGRYIAFSVNSTTQGLHPDHRVEVYDTASDIVVYNTETNQTISTDALFSKDHFLTFPGFSPDGNYLYYCSAPACPMPDSIGNLRYSLCRIGFDSQKFTFSSEPDTLFHAKEQNKSVSFPRVSPDGNYLLLTVSAYGTFPIWHKDSELYMIDLENNKGRYLQNANSTDSDSYHSWSSNSRWVVFSSRRLDGLYTHPYITYIDKDGSESKPFLLPQKSPDHYAELMQSYNIPEFITSKAPNLSYPVFWQTRDSVIYKVRFK